MLRVVQVDLEIVDGLQRTKDVAVPQEPLQSLQLLRHLGRELGIVT